jgi:hypothetical protein
MVNPTFGSTFRQSIRRSGVLGRLLLLVRGAAPRPTIAIVAAGDTLVIRDDAIATRSPFTKGAVDVHTDVNSELKVITLVVLGSWRWGRRSRRLPPA